MLHLLLAFAHFCLGLIAGRKRFAQFGRTAMHLMFNADGMHNPAT